jgi:uncharacterized protein YicC (UPF0701 family)
MPKYFSKAQTVLREVWRTAYKRGKVEITLPTAAKAHKLRFDLYAAVRAEKQADSDDLELVEAATTLEIVLGESKNVLIIQKKADNAVFKAISEATGLNVDSVIDPFEAERALESLKRVGASIPTAADPDSDLPKLGEHQDNPFYGKRG